jgi:hypothetical protein
MAGTIDSRLAELGIDLPRPSTPAANYVPYVVAGNLVFISGQVTVWNGELQYIGRLGETLSVDESAITAVMPASPFPRRLCPSGSPSKWTGFSRSPDAGGEDVFCGDGKHAPWLEWETLIKADPDVIVFMPCGFDLHRTRHEAAQMAQGPGWSGLSAVKSGRVYLTNGDAYFNRPGSRLSESLEILAEILHPEEFSFGHGKGQGCDGWEVL